MSNDLRQAATSLVRRPLLPIVIVLTMAVSVGANIGVLTVVNALWLRPRPIPYPDRTVMALAADEGSTTSERVHLSPQAMASIGADPAFEAVAGQVPTSGEMVGNLVSLSWPGVGPIETLAVTHEYFATIGLSITGRDFTRTDDVPGAPLVGIVSNRFWNSLRRSSTATIGSAIATTPYPIQVIGVAPPGFHGIRLGERVDLWIPRHAVSRLSPVMGQPDPNLLVIARLRPGVSLREAGRRISTATGLPFPMQAVPVSDLYGSPHTATVSLWRVDVLWIAVVTALLVLAGGCATLMAVMLVHHERRRGEYAIRLALGSSRRRFWSRLGWELAVLTVVGAACAGLAAAGWLRALPVVPVAGGIDLARIDLQPDWSVALTGLALAFGAIAAAALVPLRRAGQLDPAAVIGSASRPGTASSERVLQTLMGLHAAVSVVVLAAAILFVRLVAEGFANGPGWDADRTVFASIHHRPSFGTALNDVERLGRDADRLNRLVEALRARAGVGVVAIGSAPLEPATARAAVVPRTVRTRAGERVLRVSLLPVSVDFPHAIGLRVTTGRPLQPADVRPLGVTGERTVLVTEALARTLWSGTPAVGERFSLTKRATYVVAGIVGDFAVGSQRLNHRAAVLFPVDLTQKAAQPRFDLVVQALRSADGIKSAVQQTIEEVLGFGVPATVTTGLELVAFDLGQEQIGAWFFSAFGLVAFVLTLGGGFGLTAYVLDARRRELAVRLALGAGPGRLAQHVLLETLRPVATGVAAGVLAAFLFTVAGRAWIEGLEGPDWGVFCLSGLIVLASACAAGGAAMRRAQRLSSGTILSAA